MRRPSKIVYLPEVRMDSKRKKLFMTEAIPTAHKTSRNRTDFGLVPPIIIAKRYQIMHPKNFSEKKSYSSRKMGWDSIPTVVHDEHRLDTEIDTQPTEKQWLDHEDPIRKATYHEPQIHQVTMKYSPKSSRFQRLTVKTAHR